VTKADNKRGAGPTPNVPETFKSGNRKTSVEASGQKFNGAKLAKGGVGKDNKMFDLQQANPDRDGAGKQPSTGKPDIKGPGEQFAQGGDHPTEFRGALPANPGATSPYSIEGPAYRDTNRPDVGRHKPAANVPHSLGSDTEYKKSAATSDSDMPDWHRTRGRGTSPKGG
jgi:hypothetical protein